MSCHASEDALERYSLGACSEKELAELEAHLLVCHNCQDRALESDLLVKPLRLALAAEQSRSETAARRKAGSRFRFWSPPGRLVWAPALGTLLLVFAGWRDFQSATVAPQHVTLAAFRGAENNTSAHASPGAPIQLRLNLSAVRISPNYRIEIVRSDGGIEKRANLSPRLETTSFNAGRLDTGNYWVRLYDVDGILLREYGLTVD